MRLIARYPTKTDLESTFLELKINCLRETHEDVQLEITGGWVKVPKKNFCKGNFLRAVMRKKKTFLQRKRHTLRLGLLKVWDKGAKGNIKQFLKIKIIEILNLCFGSFI